MLPDSGWLNSYAKVNNPASPTPWRASRGIRAMAVVILAAVQLAGAWFLAAPLYGQTNPLPPRQSPAVPKQAADAPKSAEQWTRKRVLAMLSEGDGIVWESHLLKLTRPEVVPALGDILRDGKLPPNARSRAVMLLARIGTQDAKAVVLDALAKTPQPMNLSLDNIAGQLIFALEECTAHESEKELLADLRHENTDVRQYAVNELGNRKSVAAVPELIRLLELADDGGLWPAIALADIRDPKGIETLLAIMAKGPAAKNRGNAVEALGRVDTPEVVRALKSVTPDEPSYESAMRSPVMRAHLLRERVATFALVLEWHSPPGKKPIARTSLALSVAKRKFPADWSAARISENEATGIIDSLFSIEHLRRAYPYPGPVSSSQDNVDGYYSLEAKADGGPHLVVRYALDVGNLVQPLAAVRKLVNRDAAAAIDKVLAEVKPPQNRGKE